MVKTESLYANFIKQRESEHTRRFLTPITHKNRHLVDTSDQEYLNFSSNDYLGLSQNPALIKRSQEWGEKYGAGSAASRLVTGNIAPFETIENKISTFKGKEAALVMVSGFQANVSILPALFDTEALGAQPMVFSDKLNHASMHLGCAAAGIKQIRFRHNDTAHLSELLEKHKDNDAPKFILTESVYSMDGDIAPIDEISTLSQEHNCLFICDEAHATGVLGDQGNGLAQKADIIIGTFSKAFGSFGAYIACSQTIKDYLINKCSGIIYATALPPSVLGSIDAALDLIPTMNKERAHLQKTAKYFRNEIQAMGFDCGASQTQIVPLMIGASDNALKLAAQLKNTGFWTTAIRPPTVPKGSARIRFAFSATHKQEDVQSLLEALSHFQAKKAA